MKATAPGRWSYMPNGRVEVLAMLRGRCRSIEGPIRRCPKLESRRTISLRVGSQSFNWTYKSRAQTCQQLNYSRQTCGTRRGGCLSIMKTKSWQFSIRITLPKSDRRSRSQETPSAALYCLLSTSTPGLPHGENTKPPWGKWISWGWEDR